MEIFLVGGAVRDSLLNLPITDKDWVVVGTTPKNMLKNGYQKVGRDFPVFLHPKTHEEYALARTERKNKKGGHTGFSTYFGKNVTLEEDLKRRDLTINSMAISSKGKLIDPYHGQNDITKRLLRHTSNAFSEDPLRILRIARFAARFAHLNFKIADETKLLIQKMIQKNELNTLSSERIWKETEKALISKNPQIYFQVLKKCGALKILFPEINNLFGIPSQEKFYSEPDSGIHTFKTLSIVASLSDAIDVRFSALVHEIGKTITKKENWPLHQEHEKEGLNLIKKMCKRLRVPKKILKFSETLIKSCEKIHLIDQISPEDLITLFDDIDVWKKQNRIKKLALVCESDAKAHIGLEKITYPQKKYLNQLFNIAKTIKSKTIIKSGFKGIEVRKELKKKRIEAIKYTYFNIFKKLQKK